MSILTKSFLLISAGVSLGGFAWLWTEYGSTVFFLYAQGAAFLCL